MIQFLPWTWGTIGQFGQVATGAQWVWPADATGTRTYQVRAKGDVWVEFGHSESSDPASDTREG